MKHVNAISVKYTAVIVYMPSVAKESGYQVISLIQCHV